MTFIGPNGQPLPPEMEAQIREHMDRAHMGADVARHATVRIFEELSAEDLQIMRHIFHTCTEDDSGTYAAQLEGFITGVLAYKHNICPGCGKNHDDISDLLEPEAGAPEEQPSDGTAQLALDLDFGPMSPAEEAAVTADKMIEYNLRFPKEGEVETSPGERPVICVGCNMLFQSLEDRMLRPAGIDGCFGCQRKSATG